MNKIVFIVLLFLTTACSNMSKNMVKKGDFLIRSGSYRNTQWSDSLELKRISWFYELTLLYDVMYGKIDKNSKFYNWFSAEEKMRIKYCSDILLSINYSLDSERISHQMFYKHLRDHSYDQIAVPEFSKSLKMHPDYKKLSLSLYKSSVFCKKSKATAPIYINFPNFKEIVL